MNKYFNIKTEINGITFDSKKEAERYLVLFDMQKHGEIQELNLQPRFLLQPSFKYNGKTEKSITYVADFSYIKEDKLVVEDVKGKKTDVYKLKKKLFLKQYNDVIFMEV